MKILLISLILSRVSAEMQSEHHSMYVSRKSRSSSQPIETSYVYSHYNNDPGITYNSHSNYKSRYSSEDMMDKHRKPTNEYSANYNSSPLKYSASSVPISASNHLSSGPPVTELYIEPVTKLDIDYERTKSDIDYERAKSDIDYKRSKSDIDHERSKSDIDYKRSKSDIDYERSKSDIDYKMSKSDIDHERSKSDIDYEISKSDVDHERSKSDIDYERSKSDIDYKMSKSDIDHERSKSDIDHERSKSEAEFNSKYIPAKLKSDLMYEKLKSYMHYNPPDGYKFNEIGYDMSSDYHIDDDDIRTSSRSNYIGWPYFYHSPYEYEVHKMDSDIEKAKDKRYASDNSKVVIPVHETIENDVPNYNELQLSPPIYHHEVTTDNPIYGDKPFISFVLNDYFDRNTDDDPIVFKGFDYGKDFDFEGDRGSNVNDYIKTKRRVEFVEAPKHLENHIKSNHIITDEKKIEGDAVTEKGYSKKHDFDKNEKKKEQKETYKKGFENTHNGYRGFKDFADAYANKFGADGHKKESKFEFKNNADNGESRKGFRRVYHKDEYQEDNEFYDNKNNSARGVEGGTAFSLGNGSEGLLKSHSTAAVGNESNMLGEAGVTEGNKFQNSHQGHDYSHGYDNDYNRYRDVAKKAAQSNSADYGDHFIV